MSEQLVVIYTMNGCPFCEMMKEELTKKQIPFVERDIDEESDEYDLFIEAVDGNDFVPAFMIIESDGENYKTGFFAPERDFEEIKDGVKIIEEHYERFNLH
jgi:glutaredoxin